MLDLSCRHDATAGALLLSHEPLASDYVICGHLNLVVRLPRAPGRQPAFVQSPTQLILPAFSRFTGGHKWMAQPEQQLFVCTGDQVIALPPGRRGNVPDAEYSRSARRVEDVKRSIGEKGGLGATKRSSSRNGRNWRGSMLPHRMSLAAGTERRLSALCPDFHAIRALHLSSDPDAGFVMRTRTLRPRVVPWKALVALLSPLSRPPAIYVFARIAGSCSSS